jgi:hypothetical protein
VGQEAARVAEVEEEEEEALAYDALNGWQASRDFKKAVKAAGFNKGRLRATVRNVALSSPLDPAAIVVVMAELVAERAFAAAGEVFEGALEGGVAPSLYLCVVANNPSPACALSRPVTARRSSQRLVRTPTPGVRVRKAACVNLSQVWGRGAQVRRADQRAGQAEAAEGGAGGARGDGGTRHAGQRGDVHRAGE